MLPRLLFAAAVAVTGALAGALSVQAAGTGYIFVSNEQDNTVSVIDGETFKVIKVIETGQRPRDMRWNHDKTQLLVATSVDDKIDVIDIAKLEVVASIEAGDPGRDLRPCWHHRNRAWVTP